MDVQFSVGGCHADTLVLEHAAETAHCMPLEMGQVDHEVIVLEMAPDAVELNPFGISHGNVHRSFGIHDVYGRNFVVTPFFDGFEVAFRGRTVTAVSRVAFYKGTVHRLDQILDEFRTEMVAVGRFSRRDLYGNTPAGRYTEGLKDPYETIWSDTRCIKYGRCVRIGSLCGRYDDSGSFGLLGCWFFFLGAGGCGKQHQQGCAEGNQLGNHLEGVLWIIVGISEECGGYRLEKIDDKKWRFMVRSKDGEETEIPVCFIYKKEEFEKGLNIPFSDFLSMLKSVPQTSNLYGYANNLVLDMISAYDITNGVRKGTLFDTALQITEWLNSIDVLEGEWDNNISKLNRFQLLKRRRELTKDEKEEIETIIDSSDGSDEIRFGGYLLLDEKRRAKTFYDKFDKGLKAAYKKMPIYRFFKS